MFEYIRRYLASVRSPGTYHLLSSLTSHDNDDDSNTLTLGTNYALNPDQPDTQCRMTYKMDAHDRGLIDVDLVPKSMIHYDKTIHLIYVIHPPILSAYLICNNLRVEAMKSCNSFLFEESSMSKDANDGVGG